MPTNPGGGNLPHFEVSAGNVGLVWEGSDDAQAHKVYLVYVGISRDGLGRVGGQPVTLKRDGSVLHEYSGVVE
jgi:hypothetical protein